VPDIYQSILEFENGVIATIENCWALPNTIPHWNDIKLNVLGAKGMFNMDLTNNQTIERFTEEKADHPDVLIMPWCTASPSASPTKASATSPIAWQTARSFWPPSKTATG